MFPFSNLGSGQSQLILEAIPIDIKKYNIVVEAFGGNLSFSKTINDKTDYEGRFIINDVNQELITFYEKLKNNVNRTLDELHLELSRIGREEIDNLTQYSIGIRMMKMKNVNKMLKLIEKIKTKETYIKNFLNRCDFRSKSGCEYISELERNGDKILLFLDLPKFGIKNSDYENYQTINLGDIQKDGTDIYFNAVKTLHNSRHNVILLIQSMDYFDRLLEEHLKGKTATKSIYFK